MKGTTMVKQNTIDWCKAVFLEQGFSEDEYKKCLEKSNVILSIYRYMVWSLHSNVESFYSDIEEMASAQLHDALEYLSEFAPKRDRLAFRDKAASFAWSAYLINIIDKVLVKVVDYPLKGQLYQEILSKSYFTKFEYTDNDIAEMLQLSSSTYYRRKKEAKCLFATALFILFASSGHSGFCGDWEMKVS